MFKKKEMTFNSNPSLTRNETTWRILMGTRACARQRSIIMHAARDNRGPLIGKQAGSCIRSRINVNIYSIDFHLVCRQIRAMLVHRANAGGLCGMPPPPLSPPAA